MMTIKHAHAYNLDMTQIVAIPSKDRIVISADGKSLDTETNETSLVMPKIFPLTGSVAATIAGMGLESIEKFMRIGAFNIAQQGLGSFEDIIDYMHAYVATRVWAENDESYLHMIIAGYKNGKPRIRVLGIPEEGSHKQELRMYTLGNWDKADKYLYDELGKKIYSEIEFRDAEKVAIRTIAKAEKASPADIGGQEQLWHIFPDHTEVKSSDYTGRLRKKYGRGVK